MTSPLAATPSITRVLTTGYYAAGTQGKAGVRTSREGEVQLLNPNGGMVDAGEQEASLDTVGVEG